jgi:hypothetical protein
MFFTQDSINNRGKRECDNRAAIVEKVEKPRASIANLETPLVAEGLGYDLTEYEG